MVKSGPVSLYHFPQDVFLRIELDSFFEDGFHDFLSPLSFFRPEDNLESKFKQSGE